MADRLSPLAYAYSTSHPHDHSSPTTALPRRLSAVPVNSGRTAVHFTAVGDLLLGDSPISVGFGLHSRYPGRALEDAMAGAGPLLAGRDIVLGNLECPLTANGRGKSRWRRDQMRGDAAYASVLRRSGITALHVANNHALQHGPEGFRDTLDALEQAGIECVGVRGEDAWCARPVISRLPGKPRVGMLGYCWRPSQHELATAPFAEGSLKDALADVSRLRADCEAVVVSLHWGEDFVDTPSEAEVNAAHALVDAGATVVVGHHPQVRRPVEQFSDGVIAYSLGNFVADLVWMEALRDGAVLHVDLGAGIPLSPRVQRLRLGDAFAPVPCEPAIRPVTTIDALPASQYLVRATAMLEAQRRSAYRYAIRNLPHYPLDVAMDLLVTTLRNKLGRRMSSKPGMHA